MAVAPKVCCTQECDGRRVWSFVFLCFLLAFVSVRPLLFLAKPGARLYLTKGLFRVGFENFVHFVLQFSTFPQLYPNLARKNPNLARKNPNLAPENPNSARAITNSLPQHLQRIPRRGRNGRPLLHPTTMRTMMAMPPLIIDANLYKPFCCGKVEIVNYYF